MGVITNIIKYMAKKKVVEEVSEEVVVSSETSQGYKNEFRVYSNGSDFVAFGTMEEALTEKEENGGTITVASVK